MSVIQNFSVLPAQEQRQFAADFINKINSSKILSDYAVFSLDDIDTDDMTGGLYLEVTAKDIYFERDVNWTEKDDEDIQSYYGPGSSMPDDLDFVESILSDIKDTGFKSKSVVLDGYTLTVEDVADTADEKVEEIEVKHVSYEDAGIGHYEYWGYEGYDSDPYVAVEAKANCSATAYILLHVVAAD